MGTSSLLGFTLGRAKALSSVFLTREVGVRAWAADLWIEEVQGRVVARHRVGPFGAGIDSPVSALVAGRVQEGELLRHLTLDPARDCQAMGAGS